jgi:hypothetical protein
MNTPFHQTANCQDTNCLTRGVHLSRCQSLLQNLFLKSFIPKYLRRKVFAGNFPLLNYYGLWSQFFRNSNGAETFAIR